MLANNLQLNSADDEFNIQQKIQTSAGKFCNSVTLAAKRCFASIPFEITIARQVIEVFLTQKFPKI